MEHSEQDNMKFEIIEELLLLNRVRVLSDIEPSSLYVLFFVFFLNFFRFFSCPVIVSAEICHWERWQGASNEEQNNWTQTKISGN